MERLRIAGIGCGGRTRTYFEIAAMMPERYEVVAGADPVPQRLEQAARLSKNPNFRRFAGDQEILAQDKLADLMIIGTQDAYHVEPAIAALEKGYDLLLEKPIATDFAQVLALQAHAERLGRRVLVCHVLRYTPGYRKVKELLDGGIIGEVVSLNAVEGVGPFHQAHSYVRGHWRRSDLATPMIIAKSCHDLDILHWLVGRECESVSSLGSLSHFCRAACPEGAPARCLEGCPIGPECPYNAQLYLGQMRDWLAYIYPDHESASEEQIHAWLMESDWGRCAYQCDNDAPDHQTVSMAFAGGITATFTMTAFEIGRSLQVYGTKGVLEFGSSVERTSGHTIAVYHTTRGGTTWYDVAIPGGGYEHHGGGDGGLVRALYDELRTPDASQMTSSLSASVQSHAMGFAAERSRHEGGRMIPLSEMYG